MDKFGHFYNDKCSKELPYVCKAEFIDFTPSWTDTTDVLGKPLNCTPGWEPLGFHCYKGNDHKYFFKYIYFYMKISLHKMAHRTLIVVAQVA